MNMDAMTFIAPDEKKTMNVIASMFIKQLYETLVDEAMAFEGNRLPIRTNLILDEFSNMGPISDIESMVTACRSRNIRMTLVVQGMKQLEQVYGQNAHTIESNCSNIVFITGREYGYMQKLSDLAGNDSNGNPLITPFALQRLDRSKGEAFVMNDRNLPFITHMTDIDSYGLPPAEPVVLKPRTVSKVKTFDVRKVFRHRRSDDE